MGREASMLSNAFPFHTTTAASALYLFLGAAGWVISGVPAPFPACNAAILALPVAAKPHG